MSNSNGAATLPLLAQGSTVDVSLGGAGVRGNTVWLDHGPVSASASDSTR